MRLNKSDKKIIIDTIMQDVPSVDYPDQARQLIQTHYKKILPAAVQAIADNSKLRHHVKTTSVGMGEKFEYKYITVIGDFNGDAREPINPSLYALGDKNKEQIRERRAMRSKLESAFAGLNTRKQALECFPEFEKYLPTDDAGLKNLPITTDVMPALVTMGWPKGKKLAAKTVKGK